MALTLGTRKVLNRLYEALVAVYRDSSNDNAEIQVMAIHPDSSMGQSSTATLSNVSGSAGNVTLLASNSSRRQALFYNDSLAKAYLKFGATATTSSYTIQIQPGGYYEIPSPVYTGRIDCIWSAANGAMRITELT